MKKGRFNEIFQQDCQKHFVFSPYHKNGAEQCLRAWGHVSRYLRGYLEEGVKEEARDADEKQEVVEHRDGVGIHFEVSNLEQKGNDDFRRLTHKCTQIEVKVNMKS